MTGGRPRIAYVCPEAPWPVLSGGAHRVALLRDALATAGDVWLVVVGVRPPPDVRRTLRAEGGFVHPSRREDLARRLARIAAAAARGACIPAARYLSPRRLARVRDEVAGMSPDLVVIGDAYLTSFLPTLRALGAPTVIDTHDAAALVHRRIAAASRNPLTKAGYLLLAHDTARVERRLFPVADAVWTLSEDDARYYRIVHGMTHVHVVPNGIEVAAPPEHDGEDGTVAFVGSYSYPPNEDAALRLIRMAPALVAAGALRRLHLVGVSPTARMRRAASRVPEVHVTGAVESTRPWVDGACVVAAPLAAGSGVKVKILEALARRRAVVTTPVGAEGLPLTPGVEAEVVPLDHFADALARVLRDPARRRALGASGRALVEARFALGVIGVRVRSLVAELLASRD